MAGPGTAKQTQGFADVFGGRSYNTIDYSGVASYVIGVGELLDPHMFGFQNTIQFVEGSVDQSGIYLAVCVPVNNGITAWHVRWFTLVGMTEVTDTTNLTTKTVKLSAIGF